MQNVFVAPDPGISLRITPARITIGAIRWPERVIAGFLIYAAAMALVMPVAASVRNLVVLLNLAVILTYAAILHFDSARRMLATGVIRDWLPLGLILIAYREMGWLALPHHGHALEAHWVIWDRLVLHGGAKAAIEAFGPVLPSALEIAYALVYALAPFSIAVLYLYGRRERVDTFLFIFALGVLLCYAQFPFWPSEPPRVVFFGQDLPAYDTVFRRFNLWMLGNYGIHTSVFPSAHVAGAFAAAFGMRQALPEHKWVSRFLYAMALLIAAATVYGRYHYFPDAVAGFLVAVIVLALQRCLVSRQAMTQPGAGRSASVSMPARNRAGFDSARNADLYLSMSSPESIMALDLLIQSQEQRRESLEAGPPKSTQTMLVKQ